MKQIKKLLIATFVALALAMVCPSIIPNAGITNVEAAVKISKKKATLIKGQTLKLKITGTSKKVKWSSSKKSVAAVSSKGKVRTLKKGTAKITAKVGSKKYTCKITVQTPSISAKTASISVGSNKTLKVSGTNQKVTWKSSNTSVATVSSGKVTGKNTGTATITATVLKKKYTCKITVKSASADTVTWTSHALENGVLTIVKNNYSYAVSLTLNTVFYNSGGSMLKTSKGYAYCVEPGRECVMFTIAPYDSSYNYVNYARYENNFSIQASSSYYNTNVSGIAWTANRGTNNVTVKVTNKSNKNATFTNLSVVFYKAGKVIGYGSKYASVSSIGSTDYLSFHYPYDSNYDYIVPDDYKVFVNYSYN